MSTDLVTRLAVIPHTGECECGCGGRTEPAPSTRPSRGWIKGQPKRFIVGHNSRGMDRSYAPERAFRRYTVEDRGHASPCWVWAGSLKPSGYGQVGRHRRCVVAHRAVYEHHVGPIPDGLQLDHLCRVRACVNPDHLEPVTVAENIRRGAGTSLTPQAVVEIREALADGELQRVIAERYGLCQQSVSDINCRRIWA